MASTSWKFTIGFEPDDSFTSDFTPLLGQRHDGILYYYCYLKFSKKKSIAGYYKNTVVEREKIAALAKNCRHLRVKTNVSSWM